MLCSSCGRSPTPAASTASSNNAHPCATILWPSATVLTTTKQVSAVHCLTCLTYIYLNILISIHVLYCLMCSTYIYLNINMCTVLYTVRRVRHRFIFTVLYTIHIPVTNFFFVSFPLSRIISTSLSSSSCFTSSSSTTSNPTLSPTLPMTLASLSLSLYSVAIIYISYTVRHIWHNFRILSLNKMNTSPHFLYKIFWSIQGVHHQLKLLNTKCPPCSLPQCQPPSPVLANSFI